MQRLVCWFVIAVLPSLAVADTGAVLDGRGTVWLNGSPLPKSSAIFPGDLIQTKPDSVANINSAGSSVIIEADSLVTFGENTISLEHGSVSIATSKKMNARALEVLVTPVAEVMTEFEVTDVNGTVVVSARRSDVLVNCGRETTTLLEGQEVTRDESGKCSQRKRKAGAYAPTRGDILTNPYVLGGVAAGGGLLCLLLCGTSTSSASPSKP